VSAAGSRFILGTRLMCDRFSWWHHYIYNGALSSTVHGLSSSGECKRVSPRNLASTAGENGRRKWFPPTALQISHSSLWSTKQEVGGSHFIAEVASRTYSLLDRLVSSSTTVIVISINQASGSDVQLWIHLFRFCRFNLFMCFYIEWAFSRLRY